MIIDTVAVMAMARTIRTVVVMLENAIFRLTEKSSRLLPVASYTASYCVIPSCVYPPISCDGTMGVTTRSYWFLTSLLTIM